MTQAFGDDWPKHRLTKDLYDKWQDKKGKAQCRGTQALPLIEYADFTEYELVICKADNWREIFESYFIRKESVRESFQRLCPLRVNAMHARPITQEDELLLYVETKRLAKAMEDA